MILQRFVLLAAVLAFFACATLSRAQNNATTSAGSQSLGDAARKAREQKKDSAKPSKVFTNDDVGGLKGTISVVGGSGTQSGSAADNGAGKTEGQKSGEASEASWRAKFAAARKTLAADEKELDIMQREFNLKQQQFYTDPTAALKEQHSREDLNKTQNQIEDKKQAIEKDKQAISDLEDALHKAGGNARWADESSDAGPSESSGAGSGASGSSGSKSASNSDTTEPQK